MDYKADIRDAEVAGFGKVFHPKLPDMNLIVFKKEYGYQAICINILLDATGDDPVGACENLIQTLESYLRQMIYNHSEDKGAAFKYIAQVAFENGELKSFYYDRYRQAKQSYITSRIDKKKKAMSTKEAFAIFWNKIFPIRQHISFNLTTATT